ncbi:hypothetical protein BHK98_01905 [Hornefia porci]|uniref:Transposase n=1 Tax=Hornefia porci TaxID=2652292 RepID=A0A1Q9JFH1_9FIRM|nr:IS66 family transposase [Hornefia porci]OLR54939.1 hypothetical protein BHK98_01905 [Hornefia porci]
MENKQALNPKELKQLDKDELCRMILDMQQTVQKKEEIIAANENRIDILTQEVKLLRAQRFGRKSEADDKEEFDGKQMAMEFTFNETEAAADTAEKDETVIVSGHTRKRRPKGKIEEDLSRLPKAEPKHFRMEEDELQKIFPKGYQELPVDVVRQVEHKPAEYYVQEYHVHVYRDREDSGHIVRAAAPKKLFGKGLASPSLVSGIMNGKFVNALPLYRIEQEFERNDVPISRQTMANWMVMASERYFSLLLDCLKRQLFTHHVIHCDETPMLVIKDGRKTKSKSYMWVYRSGILDPHPVVIFDYRKTRHHSHPQEFLGDFNGVLVTDGFEAYHKLARLRSGELTIAGCWVHLNRKFKDALKGLGKSGQNTAAGSIAAEAVRKIGEIFALDNTLDEMTSEKRLQIRKETLKPEVDGFFAWLKEHRSDVTLKSLTGKAITYALNQEEYLRVFLDDGDVPMENNAAERAIRPFCIGKKNWVMSNTIHGAEASGIAYSIVETAKANGLKPYEYMKYLLEVIPQHMDDTNLDFLDDLLPWSNTLPEKCRKAIK